MNIHENEWKLMEIIGNPWTSMKNNGNYLEIHGKPMDIIRKST